jgi:5-methylcytosine-specific restriction endonuclease McrA
MPHPCPTCGKALTTERGMRQHHTKVHDEPLPNRECEGCGTEFYDEKARLEYCDNCNPNAAEHNGNWKGAKETTTCEACNDEFEYYPSDKEGHFCSDCVTAEGTFEGTRFWLRGERIERACDYCGEVREVLKSDVERGQQRFCSQGCLSKWMSENWRGENHHQWKGGEADYTGKWRSVRREALERDEYECQRCGKTMEEMGREPDVHHLIPVRCFDDPQAAHRLLNLVSLCRRCHTIVERNTEVSSD